MTRGEGADWSQDPIVERGRPDPTQPPEKTLTLVGFRGDSDRAGYRRLYFTHDLDYYAEFRDEDVLHMASIPADALPFPGEEATRVTIRRDAKIEYTRTRTGRPLDEFDIDIRPLDRGWRRADDRGTDFATCTCDTYCGQPTCDSCVTDCGFDPHTCGPATRCNPDLCLKRPFPSAWGQCP